MKAIALAVALLVALAGSAPAQQSFNGVWNATANGLKNDGQEITGLIRITSGSSVLVANAGNFTQADVGKFIAVWGAGASNAFGSILRTSITGVQSRNQVTLAAPALQSVSNVSKQVRYGTDNTAALQTLLNTLGTTQHGGTVCFDDGMYLLEGPFQNYPFTNGSTGGPANGSAIVLVPDWAIETHPVGSITLQGCGSHIPLFGVSVIGGQKPPTQGTIFATTAAVSASCSGNQQCYPGIIGGSSADVNYVFTMMTLVARNIIFRTYDNPQIIALDARYIGSLDAQDLWFDTDVDVSVATFPTNTSAIALTVPANSNAAYTYVRNITASGYYTGMQIGEHTNADNVNVTWVAHCFDLIGANHGAYAGRLLCQRAQYGLYGIAPIHFTVASYDYENEGAGNPFQTLADLFDPGNGLSGQVTTFNTGGLTTWSQNGGTGVTVRFVATTGVTCATVSATTMTVAAGVVTHC